jgi:predicted nucleotide-binding protein (sugar kinase/HSP70/actin superfamily)
VSGNFLSLSQKIGKFHLRDKIFLIPEMNRIGSHLFAATFRAFGIRAEVMDTFKGLDLGKEYSSGKECFPCQITTGDILYHMEKERKKAGDAFDAGNYVYFMPESDGPCRFGMYNKYQRIILDSFPALRKIRIGALTASDAYSLEGIIEEKEVKTLRKAAYLSVLIGDILDRLLWRIRPYEKRPGLTDQFIERSMKYMEDAFECYGANGDSGKIIGKLESLISEGRAIIDPNIPPKPRIGIVGEIYLRTHARANQDLIRTLEKYGGEIVNASIAEWVNYINYDGLREAKAEFRMNLKRFRLGHLKEPLKRILRLGAEMLYRETRQRQVYDRVGSLIDLPEDHKIGHLDEILQQNGLFTFDISIETCLSIAAIIKHGRDGFNGVVNVYPFTCMPSMTTSAIMKPLMSQLRIPYLDLSFDSSYQPGGESAIRTFMFQAQQHFDRSAGKSH